MCVDMISCVFLLLFSFYVDPSAMTIVVQLSGRWNQIIVKWQVEPDYS